MRNGKHIVMLNVEADITIGRFLKEEARKAGVVYTGAAGDEPAATLEIIGFARASASASSPPARARTIR